MASLLPGLSRAHAQSSTNPESLLFDEVCVREETDQPWSIQVTGQVYSLPGCLVIVHDSKGNVLVLKEIPAGRYSRKSPLKIEIPSDGIVGDYRIIILGDEKDLRGLDLPLSSLPKEVYGYTQFAKESKSPAWFMAPENISVMTFFGHGGDVQILDGNSLVGQTGASPDPRKPWARLATVKLEPGKTYQLQQLKTFYFGAKPGIHIALQQERIFVPDQTMREIRWWRITGDPAEKTTTPSIIGDVLGVSE